MTRLSNHEKQILFVLLCVWRLYYINTHMYTYMHTHTHTHTHTHIHTYTQTDTHTHAHTVVEQH